MSAIPASSEFELKELHEAESSSGRASVPTSPVFRSSVDNDTATSASNDGVGGSDSEMDISDELLKIQGKGCIGKVEQLPLACKIILTCTATTLALLLFGIFCVAVKISDVYNATQAEEFAEITSLAGDTLDALNTERLHSIVATTPNLKIQASLLRDISDVRQETDEMLDLLMKRHIERFDTRNQYFLAAAVANLSHAVDDLQQVRARVTANSISEVEVYSFYTRLDSAVIEGLSQLCSLQSTRFSAQNYVQFLLLENLYMDVKCLGHMILGSNGTDTTLQSLFATTISNRDFWQSSFEMLLPRTHADNFRRFKESESLAQMREMETVIREKDRTQYNMTSDDWEALASGPSMELLETAEDLIKRDVTGRSKQSISSSIIYVAVLIPLFVVSVIISFGSAFCFSLTIVGPWKRLNAIQLLTISKFVPKGFMKLMKWKSIENARIGNSIRQDMSVLVVKVKHLEFLLSQMDKEEDGFQLLTDYLDYISPIVEGNHGFMDKNYGNQFVFYFTQAQKAVRAATQITRSTQVFNSIHKASNTPESPISPVSPAAATTPSTPVGLIEKRNKSKVTYPAVQISLTVASGVCLIGTIGQNKRMDSACLSPLVKLALKMQRFARKAKGIQVLCTKAAINKVNKSAIKGFSSRYLGRVWFGKTIQKQEIYEVISDVDVSKMKSKLEFTSAVVDMMHGKLAEAALQFEQIYKVYGDQLAQHYKALCHSLREEQEQFITSIQVSQVLSDKVLLEAFTQFATQEHSDENLALWILMKEYKAATEIVEKQRIVQTILTDFLDPKSPKAVNISAETIKQIHQSFSTYPAHLFSDLKTEVELLCKDTFKRFRATPNFREAFAESSINKPVYIPLA